MSDLNTAEIKWNVNAKTDSNPIVRIGVWSIGLILVLFILWGSLFQLSSAVITPGTLVSEGRNKLIQHSIGGRVQAIFVREGDQVDVGQVILELDPTQAQAELSKLDARHASLSALKSRLDAERSGGARSMPTGAIKVGFKLRGAATPFSNGKMPLLRGGGEGIALAESALPKPVKATPDDLPGSDELLESQRDAYRSGRALLTKEIDALEKKAQTLGKQKNGIEARIKSQIALIELNRAELKRLKPLAANGYVARNRIDERERALLESEGAVAALELDAASVENQIGEVAIQIEKARIANSDTASREYARIVAELAEIADQRVAARAVVGSMVVRSPESGTLVNLSTATIGGVFGGGDVVGEIVPEGAPLLVEARVSPSDIDFVRIGQSADVAITAFNRRLDDTMDAEVVYVSADADKDEKSGEQYFVARLKFTGAGKDAHKRQGDIQAGMQGEVYIHTGSRTFLTYLGKPLIDSFRRAFRER